MVGKVLFQNMPKVSLIIPTKNEEKMLPKLLDTIKAQTFRDYEVIVADAHSTDDTAKIATSYGAKVVEGGMPGPGRNKGAVAASGEIIAFFDADVQLPSNRFLEDCINEMDKKGLDVATCKVRPISRKPIDRALHEVYNAYVVATEKVRPHAPGFCILVRRHAHQGIKGFDEQVVFAEDHDYVQRAKKHGHAFGILRSHPIAASVRRLEKDGRLSIALKYIFGELHMLTKGSIKEDIFEYKMGGDKEVQDVVEEAMTDVSSQDA
jgi:glycosyltransferase involved in cell wall biosynthesis